MDAIVVHPDAMDDPRAYRPLGSCLVLENMDARKPTGRTVAELAPYFAALPEAGLLPRRRARALGRPDDGEPASGCWTRSRAACATCTSPRSTRRCRHVPLTAEHEARFGELLRRCPDVPWILEAPLP